MNLKTNIIKKLKNYIVKKVALQKMFEDDEFLNCQLKLRNFWTGKKHIKVQYSENNHLHSLPFTLNKDVLTVKIPKQFLFTEKSKHVIKLYINKKLMWITPSDDFKKNNEELIIGDKLFKTLVNKNIFVNRKFSEFNFKKNKIYTTVLNANYNSVSLKLEEPIPLEDNPVEVYAFYRKKVKLIASTHSDPQKVILQDFTLLGKGSCQLFIGIGNHLYRMGFRNEQQVEFTTFNHQIKIAKKNNNLHLRLRAHILDCPSISIDERVDSEGKVILEIPMLKYNDELRFVVDDTKSDKEYHWIFCEEDNTLIIDIPIETLAENFTRKRFFVISEGEHPIKYQFDIRKTLLEGLGVSFTQIISSQHVSMSFYKRRDHSLGFKVSKPKVRKMVTGINDFKLSGYIDSLGQFENCSAFLYIEERDSLESIQIPIDGTFEVDLKQLDLVSLKSKDKTLMDFFVVIINSNKEIVRKEKIKYEYADYKKDNYYDYRVINDDSGNQHHFLITTTPFSNLKVEVFEIPHHIEVPIDTSEKDPNVWLLGERYNTAQDNGFTLFQWLQENTTIDAYYVIEDNASDYEKIKENPNVVAFGSQEHFDIAWKAKVLLGTHDLENLLPYKPAKGFFHYEDTYKVFLQHGVLGRKNVEYHKKYYETPFDLFLVSSDSEKYNVVMKRFGYDEEEVAVTGLARFDNLTVSNRPKDILLMPTWRDWINTDERFLSSEYYATYASLIKNPKLLQVLDDYNVNLNFYPHYRAQIYFNEELVDQNARVKFIPLGSQSVQQLLIDHALLITDYSSVSFDFTLMNKPVIYYHFDVKRFFKRGILRPVRETFIGRIAYSEEEIVALIEERIKREFENYDVDISGIIKFQDHLNSERIYKTICSNIKHTTS